MILLTCPRYCHNVFCNIMEVLYQETRDLGYHVTSALTEDVMLSPEDDYRVIIVLGSQHVQDLNDLRRMCRYLVVLNLEQLVFKKWDFLMDRWRDARVTQVWDYSQENIRYMNDRGFDLPIAKIHLGFSSYFKIEPYTYEDRRVAFIGNMSEHRLHALSRVTSVPYKVYHQHYYEDYKAVVAQHRVFLNIHFQVPAILEIVRILPLVCNRKTVISEHSIDHELDTLFQDVVHFVEDICDDTIAPIIQTSIMTTTGDHDNYDDRYDRFENTTNMKQAIRTLFAHDAPWVVPTTTHARVCIATLHCNNRTTIFRTIRTFFEQTDVHGLDLSWIILSQGSDEDHNEEIERLFTQEYPHVRLHLIPLLINMGWSSGMNELYSYVEEKGFVYVLHLEDDWVCDARDVGRAWLDDCMRFMETHRDTSTLFLRRYQSDEEKLYYGWTKSIWYQCFKTVRDPFNYQQKLKASSKIPFRSLELREIPSFLYTANPTLFRFRDYKDLNVFPFPVYKDASQNSGYWSVTKPEDAPEWGHAEAVSMEKILPLRCMNVNRGFFHHHF